MGCVNTKADINDTHPNIFEVMNVDEYGCLINTGQLELKDTELIFYQKGKTATRWPLQSIRRYGFDLQIFSFECGRRCATGPGIYAFRCQRAEQLFNLLQQYIQLKNISEDRGGSEFPVPLISTGPPVQQRPLHTLPEGGNLIPITAAAAVGSGVVGGGGASVVVGGGGVWRNLSRPGSLTGSNGPNSPSTPPVLSPPPDLLLSEHNNNKQQSALLPVPEHPYTNLLGEPTTAAVISCGDPSANLGAAETVVISESHCYMNVDTNVAKDLLLTSFELDITRNATAFDFEEAKRSYANIDMNTGIDCFRQPLDLAPVVSPSNPNFPETPTYVREVNYAELDLVPSSTSNTTSEQTPTPDSPPPQPNKSYVTIDFKKTNALLQSVNPSIDVEEGSRKTRHNSTISDITTRNSNSLSD